MKPTLCLYHANCTDGFGAAFAVHKLGLEQVSFVPVKYGEAAPAVTGKHVIIVDFSYSQEVLEAMSELAASILVIDHHKSAQAALAELPSVATYADFLKRVAGHTETGRSVLCTVFDMNRSGAGIAWDFFHPQRPRPMIIEHIQDYDLWKFQLPYTREVTSFINSFPQDFEVWEGIMRTALADVYAQGSAIARQHRKDVEGAIASYAGFMYIGEYYVPALNVPGHMASLAGELLLKGHDFSATFRDSPKGRSFSLRSVDGGADVSAVAALFGGGGHRGAAGFAVPVGHPLASAKVYSPTKIKIGAWGA
jgi:oligoribonuclease NrnB/cAMP/cGMP phosphodiesterase (DHH superfamily)